MNPSFNKSLDTILQNKTIFTGIAMILIIMCHLGVIDPAIFQEYKILKVFGPGFIGVDIFLFYSGYTLGFSLSKRSVKEFYKKRFVRIYPLFVVFAVISTLATILKGQNVTLFDWVCNITTLSYYNVGGQHVDWYLSVLPLFYISYPLAIRYVNKCKIGGG